MDGDVIIPEIFPAPRGVRIIVHRAATKSVEVLIAALQRTELRQLAEVPFADQRSAVASLLQQGWQGRMFGRETDTRISRQRLLETDAQAILVTAGDQPDACCGADGGVRIGLKKAHSFGGNVIDVRGVEIGA